MAYELGIETDAPLLTIQRGLKERIFREEQKLSKILTPKTVS